MVATGDGAGSYPAPIVYPSSPEGVGSACDAVIEDLDSDGDLDVGVASYETSIVGILLNDGAGAFEFADPLPVLAGAAACPCESWGALAAADIDRDSRMDLVVSPTLETNTGGQSKSHEGNGAVWFGNGDGTFEELPRVDRRGALSRRSR